MTDIGNSASRLEPFLLMSKSAKGAAAAKLIQDVTSAPGVFVFAELFESPNIQELTSNEQYASSYALLQLFSYKTYEEYARNKSSYPTLSPAQLAKLKHLSLATYALDNRILSYSSLQTALDVPSIRALEDIIIDAIYSDIIRGKLDQKRQHFEVEWVMGRDLSPGAVEELLKGLQAWSETTSKLLGNLDSTITSVQASQAEQKRVLDHYTEQQQKMLGDVVAEKKTKEGLLRATRRDAPAGFALGAGGFPAGTFEDRMDVDEFTSGPSWEHKKKKQESQGKTGARKRNRF